MYAKKLHALDDTGTSTLCKLSGPLSQGGTYRAIMTQAGWARIASIPAEVTCWRCRRVQTGMRKRPRELHALDNTGARTYCGHEGPVMEEDSLVYLHNGKAAGRHIRWQLASKVEDTSCVRCRNALFSLGVLKEQWLF